ncbi:hypothetical protein [Paenibacillus pini]
MLRNQTRVLFNSGEVSAVAYSNTVNTPLVGPSIKLIKQSSELTASLHQTLTFEISVFNEGNKDANVIFYDNLPEGMSFIMNSVLRDGSPLPGANPNLGIDIGTVHMGTVVKVFFQTIITSIPDDLKYTNQGSAVYSFKTTEGRTITGSVESNPVDIRVIPFQLSMIATISTDQTFTGDVITYQVTITNQGNIPLQLLILSIPLPAGVVFVPGSVTINDMYIPAVNPDDGIPLGSLLPGASVQLRVSLRIAGVPETNPFFIQSVLYYTANDTEYSALANLLQITYVQPLITITNDLNITKALVGEILTYTTIISNEGNFAVEANLKNTVPQGLLFVPNSLEIDDSMITGSSLPDSVPLGTLRPGQFITIRYQEITTQPSLQINDGKISQRSTLLCNFRLSDGRVVQNTFYSNYVNVDVFASIIEISASPKTQIWDVGETISFQLLITNLGNLTANVTLLKWIQSRTALIHGIVLKNGEPLPWEDGFYIGAVLPGNSQALTYIGHIQSDLEEDIEEIQVYFKCKYEYHLDENTNTGEAKSNICSVIIETNSE